MTRSPKCRCGYLTVNPWAKYPAEKAARIPDEPQAKPDEPATN